jgi:hypothetical protein
MSLQDNLDAFRAFAIGRDGIIHYAEVSPNYTRRRIRPDCFRSSTE